jgi:hypothetical protein
VRFSSKYALNQCILIISADFLIGDYTFEVGGKNKGLKQIQGIENVTNKSGRDSLLCR